MAQETALVVADVRIDLANERVWRGEQAVKLTPTAFALLRYLVEHAGQLVTKAELLQALWPETAVTEGVLTTHVGQLRQALGDEAKAPRFIETVHRRGYRFIGKVASSQYSVASRRETERGSQLTTDHWPLTTLLVGREAELQQLHDWLAKALAGERQLVFVTGEAGLGKTTVVEAFLMGIRGWGLGVGSAPLPPSMLTPAVSRLTPIPTLQSPTPNPWIGRGQCIEHHGPGEAYLPVLEALGRLCREPEGQRLVDLLSQHAPTWLVQMPALLRTTDLEALQRRTHGATRERMLRELAEAIEVLTTERPLVLWLEDLQWSDVSTLDWLALTAARSKGPG